MHAISFPLFQFRLKSFLVLQVYVPD